MPLPRCNLSVRRASHTSAQNITVDFFHCAGRVKCNLNQYSLPVGASNASLSPIFSFKREVRR
jgi:hypothetical protein